MTDLHTPRPTSGPGGRPPATPPWYVGAVAALLGAMLVLLVVLVVVAIRDDGDQDIQTAVPSTATTEATLPTSTDPTATTDPATSTSVGDSTTVSSSASTSTSTSIDTTTSVPTTTSTATSTATSSTSTPVTTFVPAVWPWHDSSTRYDDPVDAARGFAEDFLGFRDPVLGPYLAGDGRSGEIELRPTAEGPITTVLVRQVSDDDSWWVVGAVTANIEVTSPDALQEIDSPLAVRGEALAFEGSVEVDLLADGSSTPIASGAVTGGGTELAPFEGSFEFDWPDVAGGAVVFRTTSAEDGQVWEASVVRVRFPLPG